MDFRLLFNRCTEIGKSTGPRFSISQDSDGIAAIDPAHLSDFIFGMCNQSSPSLFEVVNTCTLRVPFNFTDLPEEVDDSVFWSMIYKTQNVIEKLLKVESDESYLCILLRCGSQVELRFPHVRIPISFYNINFKFALIDELISGDESSPTVWKNVVGDMSCYYPVYGHSGLRFVYAVERVDLECDPEMTETPKLSMKEHRWYKAGMLNGLEWSDKPDFWFPLLFGANYSNCVTETKISESSPESDHSSANPSDMILDLLPLLSYHRKENLLSSTTIGRCILNIFGEFSNDGLNLWEKWMCRPQKDEWETLKCTNDIHKGLGIRTIGFFARQDNPKEYEEWHNVWVMSAIKEAIKNPKSHVPIAEMIHRFFWLDFFSVGDSKHDWYQFDLIKNHLISCQGDIQLKAKILSTVKDRLNELMRGASTRSRDVSLSIVEQKEYQDEVLLYNATIVKLQDSPFLNNVISACRTVFFHGEAKKLFNKNPNLIAWANGVSEIMGNNVTFRNGLLEDYITKTTGIPLLNDFHEEHPLVIELIEWIKKVFPDEDLLHYFMKICSSFMYGRNAEKYFMIWSGDGNNSKSVIIKLLKAVLGSYAIDLPVAVLGPKQVKSSGPTPELSQADGAHLAVLSEPDAQFRLDTGAIKRLTGGDSFFTRGCHENGGSIDATFTLVFMCNKPPMMNMVDQAIRNRVLFLPFLSTFSDDAPENVEDQIKERRFPKDDKFDQKIPAFARPMAWLMKSYYKIYSEEGLYPPPDIVKKVTTEYLESNDPYKIFITECLEEVLDANGKPDRGVSITPTTMYIEGKKGFRRWFNLYTQGQPVDSQEIFTREMEKRLGPREGVTWYGLGFRV